MSLQELINHPMPVYSKKEEKFNTVSHFIGIILGTFFLFFGLYISLINKLKPIEFFSVIVFSLSVIMLYSMSTIYHGLNKNKLSKRIMRIVDHCTIYLLIAGTYTPICIISLFCSIEGVILLIFEWVCAIIGVIINAIALNKKTIEILSMILYLISGWMIVLFPNSIELLPNKSFFFILLGGIIYTIGSVLYGIGAKKKWFHSIFHIFCLLGTIFQSIGIFILI